MSAELRHFVVVATELAHAAGQLLLHKRGHVPVEYKEDFTDLVTAADREAEALIIGGLRDAFPRHGIIGEESGENPGRDPLRWLVDPLDGTTNYAQGLPLFGTSIGLERHGELLVGVIHLPALGETYSALRGGGAWRNGERMQVSKTKDLRESLFITGFSHRLDLDRRRANLDLVARLMDKSRGVRVLGSAATNLAYVAAGVIDAYWAHDNQIWDVAAGVLLVEEAGGTVTDMDGGPFNLFRPRLLASNGELHDTMLRTIAPSVPTG